MHQALCASDLHELTYLILLLSHFLDEEEMTQVSGWQKELNPKV